MKSRERVIAALNHKETDRVPVDIGGTDCTGIHVTALDNLRKAFGINEKIVKAIEPMMMLGLVESDVLRAVGGDVIGLHPLVNIFGYRNEKWKPWSLPNGTRILVGADFRVSRARNGMVYAYPKGNSEAKPCARMPSDGIFFDATVRQQPFSNHVFDAKKDYSDQFSVLTEEECLFFEKESKQLYENTEYAIIGDFFPGSLGDFYSMPGTWLENPRGIRDLQEWILAHYDHPQYVHDFFELHTEFALKNLERYRQAVGDRIVAIAISGTDFGTQNGPYISPHHYREYYKPYHKIINNWIHSHTNWKVFFHSCGSVSEFIEDFIDAGVDILNPIQFTAKGMDLLSLKRNFGRAIVFYGGGVDTQKTLPFGSPEEVMEETKRNVEILSSNGGYVCAAVHNIQGPTPVENIIAFFEAINN